MEEILTVLSRKNGVRAALSLVLADLRAAAKWTSKPQPVVTCRLAYGEGSVDVCDWHGAFPTGALPVLGRVEVGSHEGVCDECVVIERQRGEEAYVDLSLAITEMASLVKFLKAGRA